MWSAEHHFTDYHMCPSVTQFLSWVAARTQRVLLGSMVVVLPWHDPVRVAEEITGFRKEMSESRRRFREYAEAILTGLETGAMAYDGELYHQPPVELRPGPFASFRGRVYASAVSPESAEIMARLGVGIMVIAQKPWDTTEAEVASYRELYREMHGIEPPKPLLASWVAVHESQSAAEQVAEQLVENVRRLDAAGVIGVFSYGGMPLNMARDNMDCFARRVLPVLQGIDTGAALLRTS